MFKSFKFIIVLFYLQVFITLVFCLTNQSFNVAVLMVKRFYRDSVRFDWVHIGPGIDIAIEKCERDYNIKLKLIKGKLILIKIYHLLFYFFFLRLIRRFL